MKTIRKISDDIVYLGASSRSPVLFENIFPIPLGVSYNSYLILDEKTALMDTVDFSVSEQFFENLSYALNGRNLDYLVVSHMEPDHCSAIKYIAEKYSSLKIVGNTKTFEMMSRFFHKDYSDCAVTVKEGDTLSLGKHTLKFVMAPMVHWPEVMMSYDETSKTLFSADAFGTFGALNGNIFADEVDYEKKYLDEARRYYSNIVGKYGASVKAVLKKAEALDIKTICPLHGPVFRENLSYIIEKYNKWGGYEPEETAVVIFYASMYGNTASAVDALAAKLADRGMKNIAVYNVSNTDVSYLIGEIFRCSHLVFACPTYNGEIYPVMENLLTDMINLSVQKRTVAVMENGTWAPTAARKIKEKLTAMKSIHVIDNTITIKSSMCADEDCKLSSFADAIYNSAVK